MKKGQMVTIETAHNSLMKGRKVRVKVVRVWRDKQKKLCMVGKDFKGRMFSKVLR
jgi:hypothetical protein